MEVGRDYTLVLYLLCVPCLLLLPLVHATEVRYCDGRDSYAVEVQRVDLFPDPVVSGKPVTFNVSASTGEPISIGNMNIQVFYFGIRVHTETRDLCEEVSCPIPAGDFKFSHTQILGDGTPPGKYFLKLHMEDEKKLELTCITFNFKIAFGSLVTGS